MPAIANFATVSHGRYLVHSLIRGNIMTAKKIANHCSVIGHGLAIACALCGLGLIVAAPLASVVYGVILFGAAIAIDVIVAVNCPDRPHYPRVPLARIIPLRASKRHVLS
ncbi:MAG: hypothetical protein ABIS45_03940 [Burkholderiales bacterium]